MDATPVPCGQSAITAKRSGLYGYAGYGYCPSHSRWYWGSKLLLIVTCEGTVTGFGLANPKLAGEREQAWQCSATGLPTARRPAPRSSPTRAWPARTPRSSSPIPAWDLTLIRPARKDERTPRYFPNWLRQRVEAIIWTLKSQLGLERHGGRAPAGLWARIVQRLARPQRRHLAQLADRRAGQALPDRLRSLTCSHFPVNDLGEPTGLRRAPRPARRAPRRCSPPMSANSRRSPQP